MIDKLLGQKKLLLSHLVGGGMLNDRVALLDTQTGEMQTVYTDPNKLTSIVSAAPGGETAIVARKESTTNPRVKLQRLDLMNGSLTPLIEQEDANTLIASVLVWSPARNKVAFTVVNSFEKGSQGVNKIVVLNIDTGRVSTVVEVANPALLARPLAWLSGNVLLVNNLGGEALDQVLYSIHIDGTGIQRILSLSGGRFLTVLP